MAVPDAYGQDRPGPLERAAPQNATPEFAGYIVNRLSSISLSLQSARSIVGKGPAGDRIAAVTGEVDRMIGDIREMVSCLGSVVKSIFNVAGLLQAAAGPPEDAARLRIAEALHWLDDLAGQIRDHVFNESSQGQRRVR
jgi:hypothetical protein